MNKKPRKITKQHADEIIKGGGSTICYKGEWYDITGVNTRNVRKFVTKILKVSDDDIVGLNLDLSI